MQNQWSITRRSALKTLATSGGMAVSALLPTRPTLPAEKAGDRQSLVDRLRGPLVPISTAFKDDDSMDLKSTAEWVGWLIKQGIKLFLDHRGHVSLLLYFRSRTQRSEPIRSRSDSRPGRLRCGCSPAIQYCALYPV